MSFNSLQFLAFMLVAIFFIWNLKGRPQKYVVLALSYFFYGTWNWRFLALIVLSTVVDYSVARALDGSTSELSRRRLLLFSLVVNLGVLGIFKYFNFFIDSAAEVVELLGLGDSSDLFVLEILLPVGISFYTFQTMSYTIDVYRRRILSERDFLTFAVFVAYFPQLVAGPIERADRLLPQLRSSMGRPSDRQVVTGIALVAEGLVRKVVLGDVAARLVDSRFGANDLSIASATVAVLAFSIQIYGDFSGYSSIARGVSRLIGVELSHNFHEPYLSRSVTEFWRRWHISLSNWLRDYLYISLGGNRKGSRKTMRNLLLTMLLGGLWHGAGWNFVVWGLLHGLYLAGERLLNARSVDRADEPLSLRDIPAIVRTLVLVGFAWVFFRAETVGDTVEMLKGFTRLSLEGVTFGDLRVLMFSGLGILALDLLKRERARGRTEFDAVLLRAPALGLYLAAVLLAVLLTSGGANVPFIYFQF